MRLYDRDAFIGRVSFAARNPGKIAWIVGSPLAYELPLDIGVPGVAGVVDLIRGEFAEDADTALRLEEHISGGTFNTYQNAFSFLTGYKGQQAANSIVQKAVLHAYSAAGLSLTNDALSAAERNLDGWKLPRGVSALAEIIDSRVSTSNTYVITTNFDPLIEVGLRRAGRRPITSAFHRDGNPSNIHSEDPHVVHLHGYWIGSDTLHAPDQLLQERPQLKAALANYLRSSLVVVIGYSGWDDVVTQAIAEVMKEDVSFPDVVWAFHESNEHDIGEKYSRVLSHLRPGLERNRVTLYGGIDCHDVLPAIALKLSPPATANRGSSMPPVQGKEESPFVPRGRASDSVPTVDKFFGRIDEFNLLRKSNAKVVSLSGIGGQGKSILAAKFMSDSAGSHSEPVDFILDWKDCKEEGNTAHLNICLFIEAATAGRIRANSISRCTPSELGSLFSESVLRLNGILVLDNIDTYVDVENQELRGAIQAVVERHLRSTSEFKIVLTSRPKIQLAHDGFFSLHIGGLGETAVRQLYEFKSTTAISQHDLDRLIVLTGGHALWIVLLAAQKLSSGRSTEAILQDLSSESSDIGRQILRGTFQILKNDDQEVLKSIGELERPESERDLEEITGLRYNRLSKALKRLIGMNLVIERIGSGGKRLLDLHPLVRLFVRSEYRGTLARATLIDRVLGVFDRRLSSVRGNVREGIVSQAALQWWLHKVEILINREHWEFAVEELEMISGQLEKQGFSQELIRLSEKIFVGGDWTVMLANAKHFRKFVSVALTSFTYFGQHSDVERWTQHYESHSPRGGADAVVIGATRAFDAWFRKDFEEAIELSKEARELRSTVDVSLDNDPGNTYSLALRDSGRYDEGLVELLEGLSLKDALAGGGGKGGTFYGNIGRCLQLQGETLPALRAYALCYEDFESHQGSGVNEGWLRHWVGECLVELGKTDDAFLCFQAAAEIWKSSSPVLQKSALDRMESLALEFPGIDKDRATWKVERRFRTICSEQR